MIQTWVADVTALLNEENYQFYYRQVPDFRRDKADKLKFQADKALSVGAWILWEKMREHYALAEDITYNLSHSGSLVMCSVNCSDDKDVKVGCDVEKIKAPNLKVAGRFFCGSEYEKILKNESLFYRFWVLKESFMKATRLGMKLGMDRFEIGLEDDRAILKSKPDDIEGTFYFKEYKCQNLDYKMAVCSTSEDFAEQVQLIYL